MKDAAQQDQVEGFQTAAEQPPYDLCMWDQGSTMEGLIRGYAEPPCTFPAWGNRSTRIKSVHKLFTLL